MEIRTRINGCWLGKAIGGTLGTPHEGKPGPLDLEFYDPIPTGVLPNDDLDLQIVWLHHLLASKAQEVTPALLSQAWQAFVGFPFDEYAICLRNSAYGLNDERLGSFDNWFSECMGAAIRSELWACLAPGDPERAAGFAWADAVCDHAGDGVWAEIFFAALEAAAFTEQNRDRLIDCGLDFLPGESRVRRAIIDTRRWWAKSGDWLTVRNQIHEAYGNNNFTDVGANLGYTILGWLAGGGDFGQSILLANNCGADTDCTAATLGSILGIIDPAGIPQKWKAPVGTTIVLSPQITGFAPPSTVDDLTAQTVELQRQLRDFRPRVGGVDRREPTTSEQSPIRIPVQIGWTSDAQILNSPAPPQLASYRDQIFPGHWIQRGPDEFEAPVMLLKFSFELEDEQAVRISHWSQTEVACWVDEKKAAPAPSDPVCRHCSLNAPSFNRGGRGNSDVPQPLAAGKHELIVAWSQPRGEKADLVVGIANLASRQWLPYALARRV